jgi:hypothetical protein
MLAQGMFARRLMFVLLLRPIWREGADGGAAERLPPGSVSKQKSQLVKLISKRYQIEDGNSSKRQSCPCASHRSHCQHFVTSGFAALMTSV